MDVSSNVSILNNLNNINIYRSVNMKYHMYLWFDYQYAKNDKLKFHDFIDMCFLICNRLFLIELDEPNINGKRKLVE